MSERDYVRPGGVRVEPESLEQFAERMGTDHQAFEEGKGSVENDCFADILMPYAFAGELSEDAGGGGLPEAAAYARAYGELENGLRIITMQIAGGLIALQSAATFVHTTYMVADGFGAAATANAFASYDGQKVADVFSGNGIPVDRLQDSGETEVAGSELSVADEQWQEELVEQQGVDLDAETEHAGDGTWNPGRPEEVRYYDRVQHMEVEVDGDEASLDVPLNTSTRDPEPHPTLEETDG
jgi:hypothetical protein